MTDDLHVGRAGPPGSGGGEPLDTARPADNHPTQATPTDSAKTILPHDGGSAQNGGLSDDQLDALDHLEGWFRRRRGQQTFRFFGYAGTGKTTVAKHVPDLLGVNAMYMSFTGKAASVLRAKGCKDARTIHSLLYAPDREPVLDEHGRTLLDADGKPVTRLVFGRRNHERVQEELCGVGLLIVDEVSMVSDAMVDDLLALGRPILVLGDPEQLPPVGGRENRLMTGTPDVLLEEIHRTALDSPVTKLATRIRLAHPLDPRLGMADTLFERVGQSTLLAADQVLAWKNLTRWEHIRSIRAALDRPPSEPVAGDVVTFLRNRPDLGLFNGQQAVVVDVLRSSGGVIDLLTSEGPVAVDAAGFTGLKGEEAALARSWRRTEAVPATFGQVSTVHKAQGSEWGRVLVIDETPGLRGMEAYRRSRQEAGMIARRWLYTAVTRASSQVVVTREVMA